MMNNEQCGRLKKGLCSTALWGKKHLLVYLCVCLCVCVLIWIWWEELEQMGFRVCNILCDVFALFTASALKLMSAQCQQCPVLFSLQLLCQTFKLLSVYLYILTNISLERMDLLGNSELWNEIFTIHKWWWLLFKNHYIIKEYPLHWFIALKSHDPKMAGCNNTHSSHI